MKPLRLPAKTGLLLGAFSAVALAVSAAGLAAVDLDARRITAAEGASRDLAALDAKLAGVMRDPAALPLLGAAVREIGRYAGDTGQPRMVLFRTADGRVDGGGRAWPDTRSLYRGRYVRTRTAAGQEVIGVVRPLPSGAALFVGRPVAHGSPLRRSLGLWGIATALLLVGLSVVTALVVGRQTARRIRRFNDVCDSVAKGDVAARIDNAGPADELGILARHMNGMLGELERRFRSLREASDLIAHDLRTPLARVRARLSGIEAAGGAPVAAEAARAAQELDRLMEAFNGLLDLREIETGSGEPPQPFAVAAVIEDAAELYEAVAEDQKGVRIHRAVGQEHFVGYRPLVVRALANLLDNAVKVSPQGGTIEVVASLDEEDGEAVLVLAVCDQGPGFAQQPATRGRSTLGGHGLGLSIVRAIAERHRGTLALANGWRGAIATLTLRQPRFL